MKWVVKPRLRPFCLLERESLPIVHEAACPGTVWTGAENLAPIGIRYPKRPARSGALYRLSYSGLIKRPRLNLFIGNDQVNTLPLGYKNQSVNVV